MIFLYNQLIPKDCDSDEGTTIKHEIYPLQNVLCPQVTFRKSESADHYIVALYCCARTNSSLKRVILISTWDKCMFSDRYLSLYFRWNCIWSGQRVKNSMSMTSIKTNYKQKSHQMSQGSRKLLFLIRSNTCSYP